LAGQIDPKLRALVIERPLFDRFHDEGGPFAFCPCRKQRDSPSIHLVSHSPNLVDLVDRPGETVDSNVLHLGQVTREPSESLFDERTSKSPETAQSGQVLEGPLGEHSPCSSSDSSVFPK
jgi:hypothetical protein